MTLLGQSSHRPARIDQLLPSYAPHDAIGNHVALLQEYFRSKGYQSDVFTVENRARAACPVAQYSSFSSPNHVALYHMSVGSGLSPYWMAQRSYPALYYHNITPHEFFRGPDLHTASFYCRLGLEQLPAVARGARTAWSASRFSQAELAAAGFVGNGAVIPVLRDYEALASLPRRPFLARRLKDRPNILFIGRFMPHKGQLDLVFFVHALRRHFGIQRPRLLLVGSGPASILAQVTSFADVYDLSVGMGLSPSALAEDVVIVEGAEDRDLAECLRSADVFVSLSEHEGFCVPLVEAMAFGVPIVAHPAAAVGETLGDAGQAIDKFDSERFLSAIAGLLRNAEARRAEGERSHQGIANYRLSSLYERLDVAMLGLEEDYARWRAELPA